MSTGNIEITHVKTSEDKFVMIVDIDDTLSNASHRRHFIEGREKNWEGFFDGMSQDTVNEHIKKKCEVYPHEILLMTGRTEKYKEITEKWLEDNNIRYHYLVMKPDKDKFVKDFVFKEKFTLMYILPEYKVECAIDDRLEVRKMFHNLGIKTYHPDEFKLLQG